MKRNHVKPFGRFINEGYYYGSEPESKSTRLRSELVGGKGQKAQYDELTPEEQTQLEMLFTELSGDRKLAKMFVRGMSSYNSIEDIKAGLENALDMLRNPETGEDTERNWDMSNY